jgi:hypothetical protein
MLPRGCTPTTACAWTSARVNGITVQNSQREHLVFSRCSNFEANYLRVTSPEHSPGTVGILHVCSVNVHIMDR